MDDVIHVFPMPGEIQGRFFPSKGGGKRRRKNGEFFPKGEGKKREEKNKKRKKHK